MSLERAVAVPEKDRNFIVVLIGYDQVEFAIAVYVGDSDRGGMRAGRIFDMRLEGSVAIAQQNGNLIQKSSNRDEVGLAIVVEVSRGDSNWMSGNTVLGVSR